MISIDDVMVDCNEILLFRDPKFYMIKIELMSRTLTSKHRCLYS